MKYGFQDNLCYEEIGELNGRPVYKLLEPLVYVDCNSRSIVIPEGFVTDLASVPRLPIVYMMWGDRAHRPAVLHDYLYRKDSNPKVDKETADQYFKKAMMLTESSARWIIYYPMYLGVKLMGKASYGVLSIKDSFEDMVAKRVMK